MELFFSATMYLAEFTSEAIFRFQPPSLLNLTLTEPMIFGGLSIEIANFGIQPGDYKWNDE